MKLSFDDKESFIEAAESLRFKNTPSDPDTLQGIGSMLPQDSASNEIICFSDPTSDPKTPELAENSSLPLQEKSEVICLDNPPDNTNTLGQMGSMTHQEKSGET